MKKKFLLGAVLLFAASSMGVFSLALGAAWAPSVLNSGPNWGSGIVTFKISQGDGPVFGLALAGDDGTFAIGATFDWWLYQAKIVDPLLRWYFGAGGFANLALGNEVGFHGGARLPVGLQFFPIAPLEIYLELAPALGIRFNSFKFPTLGLQAALGLRVWF